MADRRARRLRPPKRALIGPLAMLAGGVVAGAMLWHYLMLERGPGVPERLTQHDRQALERLLHEQTAR